MKKLMMGLFIIVSCVAARPIVSQEECVYGVVRRLAITDFLKCNLSKDYNAFDISTYERSKFDPFEIDNDLIVISILPTDTTAPYYHITQNDTLGSVRLPTMYVVRNAKLFYWRDLNRGLTEEAIRTFWEFNLAEYVETSDFLYEGDFDDTIESADYYFCKNDPSNYKRVITNVATGWYKPPRIKCK